MSTPPAAAPEPALSPGREIAKIAVPVSLEFTLMLVLNFVNQVVVGALGATAIAAVGFASSLTFIVVATLGALGTSVSILVSRAYGAGRRSDMNTSVSAALLLAAGLSGVISITLAILAPHLLRLTGASAAVAALGSGYLRLTALSLLPTALGIVLSGVMRSLGHARSPMVATFITVILNTLLGYALVFGIGPFPKLGVVGAGWATLMTATLKVLILLAQVYGPRPLAGWAMPGGWTQWKAVLGPLFVFAVPLGLTELVWSGGTFLYNVIFQRLGDEALAAAQIVNTLEGVFVVGSIGLMSATTALVGRSLGQGDAPGAAVWVRRLLSVGVRTGAGFGLLFALSAFAAGPAVPRGGRRRAAGSGHRHRHQRGVSGGEGAKYDRGGRHFAQRQRHARRDSGRRGGGFSGGPAAGGAVGAVHAAGRDRGLRGPRDRGIGETGHLHLAQPPPEVGRGGSGAGGVRPEVGSREWERRAEAGASVERTVAG